MEPVFGLFLLVIIGVVTWCVASEGAWGAAITFLCVLFAGLLAMNFFEPAAKYLDKISAGFANYSDLVALVGLFALFTFLFRSYTDYLAPTELAHDGRVYQLVRWLFAAATGYTTMAFLLTALHTAPLPREFAGFKPERQNFFDAAAPDRQWLGFVQYVSERALPAGRIFDGPKLKIPADASETRVWPSFPIRYATRRTGVASAGRPSGPSSSLSQPLEGAGGTPTGGGGGTKGGF
jgi:hypothetical protein